MIIELRLTPEEAQHAKNVHGWIDPSYPKSKQWPNELQFLVMGDEAREVLALLAEHNEKPMDYNRNSEAMMAIIHRWQAYQFARNDAAKDRPDFVCLPSAEWDEKYSISARMKAE